MIPSIFLKVFECLTLADRLDAALAAGFTDVHHDMSVLGGPILPARIDDHDVQAVRSAVESRAMALSSVEATYNMAHPDVEVRRRGRQGLSKLIAAAPGLGVSTLSLCTGSRNDNMWVRHPDNSSDEAWADMLAEVSAAADEAGRAGVVLGIECEYSNVVSSAALGRRLLDEVSSPAVKIVLDAANLIPPGEHQRQEAILRHAFELLGDAIVVAHAKDIQPDGSFVAAGHGVLNYPLFATLLHEHQFDGPLILHGLTEDQVPDALELLSSCGAITTRR